MSTKQPGGKPTEDVVERICTRMFFSDFVARSPSYVKPDGIPREAADVLALFGNQLLAFQVKSKVELKPASEKSEIEFARISRVVNEAISQVKTTCRAIDNGWCPRITTVRGLDLPLPRSEIKQLTGIVVLELRGEELFPPEDRTRLFSSFTFLGTTPVHVFLLDEFDALSKELDTMPDFVEFINRVRVLYERNLLIVPPSILDLLALHKMDPDRLANVIARGTNLAVNDGVWTSYRQEHADEIAQRDALNIPSYMIDAIINFLHASIGYSIPGDRSSELGFKGQGSVESYAAAAHELASIPRLERRLLGEKLLRCMKRAEISKFSFSMVVDQPHSSATLVLSSSLPRPDRQEFLYKLCAMAYCRLGLSKIIGVATEPLTVELRSYDTLRLNDVRFSNADALAKEADKFFGIPYAASGTEFTPGTTPDAHR